MEASIMNLGSKHRRQSLGGRRRGATVIEYVTFAALVAGIVIVALEQVAPTTGGVFLSPSGERVVRAPAIADDDAPTVSSHITAAAKPSPRTRLLWQVPVLVGLGVLWALLVIRSRRMSRDDGEMRYAADQSADKESDDRLFAKRQQILATLLSDVRALSAGEVAVHHVMSSRLTTVEPSTGLPEIRELMNKKRLRHMPVCDGGRLLGIISDRDLARKHGPAAVHVMTPSPLSVPSSTLLSPAVTLMMRKRISCLPVVDDGKLVGMFTTTDLIMTLQCAFQLLEKVAPHLADRPNNARPISLRDSFSGIGEFAGEDKRPQAAPVTRTTEPGDKAAASDAYEARAAEEDEREEITEDADAAEAHAAR